MQNHVRRYSYFQYGYRQIFVNTENTNEQQFIKFRKTGVY
jgi:hypothetical protein